MMKLNKEINHHRNLFKKEVSNKMPVILESERGVMIVTATGYDDFEKLMNWMDYMEKDIKWVITGTYDNPYTKFVLDEGYGKVNTMNKYQKAYQNVQVELPHNSNDIVVLRELVDKTIPKQAEKMEEPENGFTHTCPSCGNYVGAIVYADGNKVGIDEYDYCPSCGQKLKWGH